ncbi:hypothetical protein L6258_01195 [Candidatus Parcubacteria bacterium]|nr:hypothetical protein [Candidatus Parcubacteria bacterium]
MKKVIECNIPPGEIKNKIYSSIKVIKQNESLPIWSGFWDIVGFENEKSLVLTKGRSNNVFEGRVSLDIAQKDSGSTLTLEGLPMRKGAKLLCIAVSVMFGLFGLLLLEPILPISVLLFWIGGSILKKKLEQDITNYISELAK